MRFKPGQSGNPGGRPKGSKTLAFSVRDLVAEALLDPETRKVALAKLKENLIQRKTVVPSLEFAARVNREIGLGAGDAGAGGVTIVLMSNVEPGKLQAARSRALPLEVGGA